MIEAAKVLTALAVLAAVASLHPKLRQSITAAWICGAGAVLCLMGAAFL